MAPIKKPPLSPRIFTHCEPKGFICKADEARYFASRDRLTLTRRNRLFWLMGMLFLWFRHHALPTYQQFKIPAERMIKLSRQRAVYACLVMLFL
ncbi:KUP/HAK/KT family potassium transporter [Franconibacter pulveris 1160]